MLFRFLWLEQRQEKRKDLPCFTFPSSTNCFRFAKKALLRKFHAIVVVVIAIVIMEFNFPLKQTSLLFFTLAACLPCELSAYIPVAS